MKNPISGIVSLRLSTKRHEFIVLALVLTIGMALVQLVSPSLRYYLLAVLGVVSGIITILQFRQYIRGYLKCIIPILPLLFTIGTGLFYFIFPVRWITRIPILLLYAIGMYAIFLVINICCVAVERSIQLLKVAQAVGFLLVLFTVFELVIVVYSLRQPFWINVIIVFPIMIFLALFSYWTITLETYVSKKLLLYGVLSGFMLSQWVLVLSFMPIKPIIAGLCITTLVFTLFGIVHLQLASRLFQKNIIEYVRVFIIVLVLILFSVSYR